MNLRVVAYMSLAFLAACSVPKIQELRAIPPNEKFIIQAPLNCLYNMGVEHVSTYIGMTEPPFTWHLDPNQQHAWFRQPLTLVSLKAKSENTTEVSRSQTSAAANFSQGSQLIEYLRANPCLHH